MTIEYFTQRKSCSEGFTLIEVMIAITILSMGILAVTNMQMASMRVNISSNKLTTATMIAQSLIEEIMSLKFDDPKLIDLTEGGTFTSYEYRPALDNFLTFGYDYDLYKGFNLQWEVDNKDDGTKTINVIATWKGSREEKRLVFPLQRSVQQSIE
jgi:prepilin-type N-terminal cleavage/methylation domain-containing protein